MGGPSNSPRRLLLLPGGRRWRSRGIRIRRCRRRRRWRKWRNRRSWKPVSGSYKSMLRDWIRLFSQKESGSDGTDRRRTGRHVRPSEWSSCRCRSYRFVFLRSYYCLLYCPIDLGNRELSVRQSCVSIVIMVRLIYLASSLCFVILNDGCVACRRASIDNRLDPAVRQESLTTTRSYVTALDFFRFHIFNDLCLKATKMSKVLLMSTDIFFEKISQTYRNKMLQSAD